MHKLVGHKDTLVTLNLDHVGNRLNSYSIDGNVLVWDLKNFRISNKSQIIVGANLEVSCCLVSETMIYIGFSQGLVRRFRIDDKSLCGEYKGHCDQITAVQKNQFFLFSASQDCNIRRWGLDSAICDVVYQFSDPISSIFLKENELYLVSWDRFLRVIDIEEGNIIHEFVASDKPIQCLCVNENIVYVGGSDLVIKSWDLLSMKSTTYKGVRSWVMGLNIYENFLIGYSDDKMISVWDKITGKLLEQFSGHKDGITCLGILGDQMYSGGFDQCVLVWDLEEMKKRIGERKVMTKEDIESRKIETFFRALNNTKKGKKNKKGKKSKKNK